MAKSNKDELRVFYKVHLKLFSFGNKFISVLYSNA